MKQSVLANEVADQVTRTLAVAGIKGWKFPATADIGVSLISPNRMRVRIDGVVTEGDFYEATKANDIANTVEILVAQWLVKYATQAPRARRAP